MTQSFLGRPGIAVAPHNLASMEATIRARTAKVLDELPRNEEFNWVQRVSIELTTQMLATLFDFPFEDRQLLTWWSDVSTSVPEVDHIVESQEARMVELGKMHAYFTRLWNERVNAPPKNDLVSMLAHNPATRDMGPLEYMGNLVLLIVGGNDTTRNSMSGGVLALHQHPGEWAKLRANPALVDSLVPEIIRWQTPLAYMRRTAIADSEVGGQTIRKGEKVVKGQTLVEGYSTQDGGRAAELSLSNAQATLVTADGLTALEHAVDIGIAKEGDLDAMLGQRRRPIQPLRVRGLQDGWTRRVAAGGGHELAIRRIEEPQRALPRKGAEAPDRIALQVHPLHPVRVIEVVLGPLHEGITHALPGLRIAFVAVLAQDLVCVVEHDPTMRHDLSQPGLAGCHAGLRDAGMLSVGHQDHIGVDDAGARDIGRPIALAAC